MKYLFFAAALIAIIPGMLVLMCERALIRRAALGLILPLLIFNKVAINFFSKELYRGTSRGMEISAIYIIAFTMLLVFAAFRGGVTLWPDSRHKLSLFPDWGSRIYLLYCLWSAISVFHSVKIAYSLMELWKMAMIYLVFLATYYYLEFSRGDFEPFLHALAVVVAVNFAVCISQHFSGVYQVYGTFPHQNSLAMFMQIVGILFFARYFNRSEGRLSLLYFMVFLMATAIVVRTYSRGALACYPLGLAVTLICSVANRFSMRKVFIIAVFVVIGAIGLAVVLPRIVERFATAPEASANTRKRLAMVALDMVRDHPTIGVGVNNWGATLNADNRYTKHLEEMSYSAEHQYGIVETIYLLVAAECGVPGLLLLLVWFGYYWISALRMTKLLKRTPYLFIPVGVLGGLSGIFLQSALEWVLKQQMNYMLLVIVFAFIAYINRNYHDLLYKAELAAERDAEAKAEELAKIEARKKAEARIRNIRGY